MTPRSSEGIILDPFCRVGFLAYNVAFSRGHLDTSTLWFSCARAQQGSAVGPSVRPSVRLSVRHKPLLCEYVHRIMCFSLMCNAGTLVFDTNFHTISSTGTPFPRV